MNDVDAAHFRAFGFVVLRRAFDPGPLRGELDGALDAGVLAPFGDDVGDGPARFEYVPMMNARTPVSLSLLDRFEALATALLGRPALPVRAKGIRYFGQTAWHVDSSRALPSLGFIAYLDPLQAESGALRVLPGSHRRELGDAVGAYLGALAPAPPVTALPGVAVVTVRISRHRERWYRGIVSAGTAAS